MNDKLIYSGVLVKSVQGYDKGKVYVVKDMVNPSYVHLIDGNKKNFNNPKKKNIKHIVSLGVTCNLSFNNIKTINNEVCTVLKNIKNV